MTKPAPTSAPAMVAVYDGKTCVGHLICRHWVNGLAVAFEAFSVDEKSIGTFTSQKEAADALWRLAHDQVQR